MITYYPDYLYGFKVDSIDNEELYRRCFDMETFIEKVIPGPSEIGWYGNLTSSRHQGYNLFTFPVPAINQLYKEMIDNEVFNLINDAYSYSEFIVKNSKSLIAESAEILKRDKILTAEKLMEIIQEKYQDVFELNP